jgi:hypothetical protein
MATFILVTGRRLGRDSARHHGRSLLSPFGVQRAKLSFPCIDPRCRCGSYTGCGSCTGIPELRSVDGPGSFAGEPLHVLSSLLNRALRRAVVQGHERMIGEAVESLPVGDGVRRRPIRWDGAPPSWPGHRPIEPLAAKWRRSKTWPGQRLISRKYGDRSKAWATTYFKDMGRALLTISIVMDKVPFQDRCLHTSEHCRSLTTGAASERERVADQKEGRARAITYAPRTTAGSRFT